ncbi:UDP-glucose 4-epimerase [Caballeronia temeraria]|uniref:UDP-glucose 4-epimerase n=2 Tax=Caballeronia temeraria TaxID=1777137 RepID=A0A158ATX8_9BURK|nr:UDP-glucose 4-epimerase [Caballeronia temeraria]
MSLKGTVDDANWTVTCTTEQTQKGIECSISVEQHDVDGGRFMHRFKHACTFDNEREAVLAGLRDGMTWVRLKAEHTINWTTDDATVAKGE